MNKTFYELIDGDLREMEKSVVVANPTKEIWQALGRNPKNLIIEIMPEYNAETHFLKPAYTENAEEIVQSWIIEKIEMEVIK